VTPLLATLLLAIDLAETDADLARWWNLHQRAFRVLAPAERAALIARKNARKAALAAPAGLHDSQTPKMACDVVLPRLRTYVPGQPRLV